MGNVTKFSFFESFYEAAKGLSDGDRLAFYDAVCAYAFEGEEPGFDGLMGVVWALAKPNVDSSVRGQKAGSEGGRGKRKTPSSSDSESDANAASDLSKPPLCESENPPFSKCETNMDMDMDKNRDRDMDMDMEGEKIFSSEKKSFPPAPSGGAAAAKAAPPRCPLCGSKLFKNTQTGQWNCPGCCETFPAKRFAA